MKQYGKKIIMVFLLAVPLFTEIKSQTSLYSTVHSIGESVLESPFKRYALSALCCGFTGLFLNVAHQESYPDNKIVPGSLALMYGGTSLYLLGKGPSYSILDKAGIALAATGSIGIISSLVFKTSIVALYRNLRRSMTPSTPHIFAPPGVMVVQFVMTTPPPPSSQCDERAL